ncbi:hypothetical protein [Streptomyces sp. NPDC051567]|uniref:hypothetical protein n=1 Tax=Streptomyces sp. NPDC051567 TaxID=3365660 RepID=UPI0037A0464F
MHNNPSPVPACDFCGRQGAIAFYDTTEFFVPTKAYDWASGNRFYACPTCRTLVDALDRNGLATYAELGPHGIHGIQVITAFRDHHTPGATTFTPGTHPEHHR